MRHIAQMGMYGDEHLPGVRLPRRSSQRDTVMLCHQAGSACASAYWRMLSTIIWFSADVAERLHVLAAELPPEEPEIFHQEKLDVLKFGGLVIVAQQPEFFALSRQLLPQSRPGHFPRVLSLIRHVHRTFVSIYDVISTTRFTRLCPCGERA